MSHSIRLATIADSKEILDIYAPYILNTAVSFEISVPSVNDFSFRIANIINKFPFLVYLVDDKIIGYAYASKHRERAAYCYDVDTSVYVLHQYHGSGVAHKLYECLFKILGEQGYYNAYAGYSIPNEKSMNFHNKFGFKLVGIYHKTGYKFGKWHDVAWLEKVVNEHTDSPKMIKSVTDLSDCFFKDIFNSCFHKCL